MYKILAKHALVFLFPPSPMYFSLIANISPPHGVYTPKSKVPLKQSPFCPENCHLNEKSKPSQDSRPAVEEDSLFCTRSPAFLDESHWKFKHVFPFLHLQFPFLKFKQSLSLFSTVFILSSNSGWLLSFSIYMAVCGSVSSTQHRAHHVAHTLSWQQPLCFRLPLSLCCLSSFTVSLFPSRYGYQAHASRSVQ